MSHNDRVAHAYDPGDNPDLDQDPQHNDEAVRALDAAEADDADNPVQERTVTIKYRCNCRITTEIPFDLCPVCEKMWELSEAEYQIEGWKLEPDEEMRQLMEGDR